MSWNRETVGNEGHQVVDSQRRPDKMFDAAQVRVSSVAESLHTRPATRSNLHSRTFFEILPRDHGFTLGVF